MLQPPSPIVLDIDEAIMQPEGPLVLPGLYQVRLTSDGRTYTAPLEVKMDPRVKTSPLALRQQKMLEARIMQGMWDSYQVVQQIRDLRGELKELQSKLNSDANAKPLLDAIAALDKKSAELVAVEQTYPPVGIVSAASVNGALSSLLVLVDSADRAPTAQATTAFETYGKLLQQQLAKWTAVKTQDIPALNNLLQQRQLPPLTIKGLINVAALPPDVRKVSVLPVSCNSMGAAPQSPERSPKGKLGAGTVGIATTAHHTAKPQR